MALGYRRRGGSVNGAVASQQQSPQWESQAFCVAFALNSNTDENRVCESEWCVHCDRMATNPGRYYLVTLKTPVLSSNTSHTNHLFWSLFIHFIHNLTGFRGELYSNYWRRRHLIQISFKV